ncbi:MAG TPA: hypothetical protein VKK31_22925 [Thermoanaerobaculia bacterium]|nr:hypothetical protein [Thermoanaerobaculia bacterium]
MKKRVKKLNLHRETLRNLQLSGVTGGIGTTFERNTGCACTDGCGTNTCGCGTGACGTAECTTGNTFERLSGCATNCG